MNNILKWIIISSANPDNASATIKGVLIQYIAVTLAVGSMLHLPLTQDVLYKYITDFSVLIGAGLTIFGLVRKIYYEIKGKPIPTVTQ